jgi:tRNA G10  N-methylase Trm11
MIQAHHGEADSLPFPDNHFDSLVTDPPYGYGFMGKDWDKVVGG